MLAPAETEVLTSLGLTLNQARAYLALAKCGMTTAKTISKISEITRQDVYRVMPSLEKLGLVEKALTNPVGYRAIPIQDCLKILLESHAKEHLSLESKAKTLVKTFKTNHLEFAINSDNPQFILVPQREVTSQRLTLIENSRESINVITSSTRHRQFFSKYSQCILKAAQSGVKIRVILDNVTDKNFKVRENLLKTNNFEIKFTNTPLEVLVAIYDHKEVFILTSTNSVLEQASALRSHNPCMVQLVLQYFNFLWNSIKQDNNPQPILVK